MGKMPKPLKYRGAEAPGCETWSSVAASTLVWACLSDFRVSGAVMVRPFVFSLEALWQVFKGRTCNPGLLDSRCESRSPRKCNFKHTENLCISSPSAQGAHVRLISPALHPLMNFPHFLVYMSSSASSSGAAEQSSFQRKQRSFISGFHFLFLLFGKLYNI